VYVLDLKATEVKTVKTFRSQDRRYFNVSLQTGSPRGVWNDAECTVGSSIYLTGVIGESGWYTLSFGTKVIVWIYSHIIVIGILI